MSTTKQKTITILAALALTANVILTIAQLCMSSMLTGTISVYIFPYTVQHQIDLGLFNTCIAEQCTNEGLAWTSLFPRSVRTEWQSIQAFVILSLMCSFVVILKMLLRRRIESYLPNHEKSLRWTILILCFLSLLWSVVAFCVFLDIMPKVRQAYTDLEVGVAGMMQLAACTLGSIGAIMYFLVRVQESTTSDESDPNQDSLLQDLQNQNCQGSDARFEGVRSNSQRPAVQPINHIVTIFSPLAVQPFSRPF